MAKKNEQTSNEPKPKKRRWYNNIWDAFTVSRRSYPWLTWAIPVIMVVLIVGGITLSAVTGNWLGPAPFGILAGIAVPMTMVAALIKPAMYKQVDGKIGSANIVLGNLRKGWIVRDDPVAINVKTRDIVWRVVGRAGVVLVSEGPATRVNKLLNEEAKKAARVLPNVPIIQIQIGHDDGQIPVSKLETTLRKLRKELHRDEVPVVSQRLESLTVKNAAPIPKGIDPNKARPNYRAMRGK